MFKRLVAAAFVTVLTMVGVAAPASAVTSHHGSAAIQRIIDWE
jgi:hypothetical protein